MPTRFYLPTTGAAAVSPAFDAGWGNTASAIRRRMVRSRISSVMDTVAGPSVTAAQKALLYQGVSDPIAAQTISGTFSGQVQALKSGGIQTPWNIQTVLKVVSNDGATVRGTLLALGAYGPGTDFATALTNREIAAGTALTAVTALYGDRIVLELGYSKPATLVIQAGVENFGDNSATDLPVDETTTAAYNPWIEFSMIIALAAYTQVLIL